MSGLTKVNKLGLKCPIIESFNHKISRLNISVNDSNFVKYQNTLKDLFQKANDLKGVKLTLSGKIFLKIFIIKIHVNDIISEARRPLLGCCR